MNPVSNVLVIVLLALLGATTNSVAAITVYFYGVNSPNDTNPDPPPLSVGPGSGGMYIGTDGGVNLALGGGFGDPFFYRADATLVPTARTGNILYYISTYLREGAIAGEDNYSYLRFNKGDFKPFESIAQFHFDEGGNGWLVAMATTNSGTTASNIRGNSDGIRITAAEGAAAIAAARVPEPSSIMFLWLGVLGGLACRSGIKR
ncbi:MAG: hypothetical protein K9N23_02910 [Akkermansiaceae bacterium]|nr:hypothetical protein [Akkermansiaceae bacterium]